MICFFHNINLIHIHFHTIKFNQQPNPIIYLSRRSFYSFLPFFILGACRKSRSDPSKITTRPRVFLEGAAPIPILDEYDFSSLRIGTVDNILSDDPLDRRFALWFGLDRRSAIELQKETIRNIGRRLHLVIGGQIVGVHPIEKAITNGVLPFVLSTIVSEENAMMLYQELSVSLVHIKAELQDEKG